MATVSIRLSEQLNSKLDRKVEEGIFKDKTDAMHEAVRLLLKDYGEI